MSFAHMQAVFPSLIELSSSWLKRKQRGIRGFVAVIVFTTISAALLSGCYGLTAMLDPNCHVAGYGVDGNAGWECHHHRETAYDRREPGWYPGMSEMYWHPEGDINGEVGHPLFIDSPKGTCLPNNNWDYNFRIVSGTLPPGLSMDDIHGKISGIPSERGHWIVRLKIDSVTCNGEAETAFGRPYEATPHELRFHISGTGKVIQ